MYNLSYFKEKDSQVLLDFVNQYPFALLTGSDKAGSPIATQVPLLVHVREGRWFLQGHIMRNTDHHLAFAENPKVLALFMGPNAYVSASWYSNPQIGSTWNYMTVHAAGEMTFLSDDGLVDLMKRLTLKFEDNNNQSPTVFDNLPKEFLDHMLPAIVGFEIEVHSLENVFKLSQNRDESSYQNIINQLESLDPNSKMVAQEMKKRKEDLFPPGKEWDESQFLS